MATPQARARAVRWSGQHATDIAKRGALGLLVALVLGSCAAGPGLAAGADAATLAGFWQGLWHGLISPITFIVSLFTDSVSIYEIRNNGNWYDAGFMLGISTAFSSSARSGARAQRRRVDKQADRRHGPAPQDGGPHT